MVKPGYKQTEIGVIPEDWEIQRLGEIGKFKNGINKDKEKFGYGVPIVGLMNVFGVNRINTCQNCGLVDVSKFEQQDYSLQEGDVLFVRSSVKPSGVGLTALVNCTFDSTVFSGFLLRYRCTSIEKEFKRYAFYAPYFRKSIIENSTVSANTNINQENLKQLYVALPSKAEEQKDIAEALSDADELIDTLKSLIAKKKAIKQGAVQELLTGKKRLPGFEGNWVKFNLMKNSVIKARIGWQGLKKSEYLDSGYAFLVTGTDFHDGRVSWDTCHYVTRGRYNQDRNIQIVNDDILITKDGSLGKTALVKGLNRPATLNSGIFVVRPLQNRYDPIFVYHILSSFVFKDFLDKLSAGSTIIHLYQKDLEKFEFLLPPTQEEQISIAEILSNMESEIESLEQKLAKARQLKQGMMQQLLTGKIRLV